MIPFPILTLLVLVPAIGSLLVAVLSNRRPEWVKLTALLASVLTGGMSIWVLAAFDKGNADFQFVSKHTWIKPWGISWHLGVDGISLFMVVLTGVLFPLVIAGIDPHHGHKRYLSWMLLLEAGVMGSFISLDLFLFFVFFEIVLVPMYFLIAGWGYEGRVYAATKFFLYTMTGSAFMLVGIIATAFIAKGSGPITFNLLEIAKTDFAAGTGRWLFFAFAVAFAVKVPIFPLHTWLPDAHTQAPTGGSVILAGVMLKLGTYGLLRFGVYLFPEAARWSSALWLTLAVIGIIYGAIAATMQTDLKRLVAYSSVAHLGFIVLGTFAMTNQSITGGVMQNVNHGVSTGALFLLVGMIYERRHTRQIAELTGIQKVAPIFAGVFMVVMLSSIGVPGLNGFVGEYLVLIGSFLTARWWTVVAASGVILAALYLLWAYQRVFHGEPDDANRSFPELTIREAAVMLPLIGVIVFTGIFPKPMLERIEPSVKQLIEHVSDEDRICRSATGGGAAVIAADEFLAGPPVDWFALSPLLVLLGAAMVLLVVGALTPRWPRHGYALFTAVAGLATMVLSFFLWDDITDDGATTLVGDALRFDVFSMFITITIGAAVMLVSLVTADYLQREDLEGPEVYALYLLAAIGGVVMGAANDLIVLFLGLEILSIAMYVMAASHRRRIESQESGIKYFVLGGFSSAFFLYGIAMVYGTAGQHQLHQHRRRRSTPTSQPCATTRSILAGVALMLVGLGFKVAAVPFHFWTPDVYQGAPTPVTVVHGLGGQGRRLRSDAARADLRPAALARRLPPDRVGAGRADRGGRLGDGRGADQCQAACWPSRRSAMPASSWSVSKPPHIGPANPMPATVFRPPCCTCCSTPCW